MILQTHLLNNALITDIQLKEANLANAEQFKSELMSLINKGNNGGDIAVVGLNNDIRSLFQLVRLDKVFRIYTNTQEALTGA